MQWILHIFVPIGIITTQYINSISAVSNTISLIHQRKNGKQPDWNHDLLEFETAPRKLPSKSRNRIIGGKKAKIEDYPFVVALFHLDTPFCGGSIIGERWVLTAAHCFDKKKEAVRRKEIYVRGNSADTTENYNSYLVLKFYNHKKFHRPSLDYDISVLNIAGRFTGRYEKSIQLARKNYWYKSCSSATALGWGNLGNDSYPNDLMKVRLEILNENLCSWIMQKWPWREITHRMVCTYRHRKGFCQADSGGPLYQNNTLVGVISWGPSKCGDGSPIVRMSARVSRLNGFVRRILKKGH